MKQKILIIRFSSLGDVILTSPLPINIKINNPESEITFLTKEKFRPIVKMMEGVDEIITIPDEIGAASFLKFLVRLDRKNYNIIIDLHRNNRSWLTGKILGYDKLIKYPKMNREISSLSFDSLSYYKQTIDCYNETLDQINYRAFCHRPQLKIDADNISDEVREYKQSEKDFIVIAPEAAHETKAYDWDKYLDIADLIIKQFNCRVAWVHTSKSISKPITNSLKESADFRQFVDLPFEELSNLVYHSRMSLTNDSGLMHLSSAFNKPVVALFGPTHPKLGFYPRGLFDTILEVDEYCRPCSKHGSKPCFREERFCFNRIKQEDILNAVYEKLELSRSMSPALFIDRDGTLIKEKHFLSDPDEIELFDDSAKAVKMMQEAGYKVILVSNQSGVARGKFPVETVEKVNLRLQELLAVEHAKLNGIYYCPHHPEGTVAEYAQICNCRKPALDMAEEAAFQLGIDLSKSYMIGDKLDDLNFGKAFNGRSILVTTGYGMKNKEKLNSNFYNDVAVCDSLYEAALKIVGEKSE